MRPIDADALKEKAFGKRGGLIHTADLDAAPTVEPKRGRWVEDDRIPVCSVCEGVAMQRAYYSITHDKYSLPMIKTPYCPWCGAKMDGGDSE